MRKIAVLQLTLTVAIIAAFSIVPEVAAKKRKEEGASMTTVDENNGNDIVQGSDNRAAAATAAAGSEYDDQRFSAVQYAATAESDGHTVPAVSTKAAAKQSSSKQHNAKLLNRLGMKRIRTSGGGGGGGQAGGNGGGGGGGMNHHRKRLASQSRSKYGSADGKSNSDSQMFIVKLPPHSHFYDDGSPIASHQRPQHQSPHHNNKQAPYKNLNTVPVGFVSNGKPAKVYHWNLPTIKHALQNAGGRYKGVNDVVAVQQHQHHHQMQQQQQQQMHHQLQQFNQVNDFELPSVSAGSKIVPRRTLYYKPRASGKPVKKSFVNNGKPNGFYVVSSKNAAAAPQYHKIVKAYYGDD